MDSGNIFPFKGPESESEEALRLRREVTDRIYQAILPLLGPSHAQKLLKVFNEHIGSGPKPNLQAIVEQTCELCHGPMKIEERGYESHFITSCVRCGYMDVLKK